MISGSDTTGANGNIIGLTTFKIPEGMNLSKEFILELTMTSFPSNFTGTLVIPINTKDFNNKNRTLELNSSLSFGNSSYSLNKLIISDLSTTLKATDLNNDLTTEILFLIVDDNNRVLTSFGSSKADANATYKLISTYPDTKTLRIIPYKVLFANESDIIKIPLNKNGESKVNFGKYGDLIIDKIEIASGKTNLYYSHKYAGYGFIIPNIIDTDTKKYMPFSNKPKYIDNTKYMITLDEELDLENKIYLIECTNLEKAYEIYLIAAIANTPTSTGGS